MYFSCCTHINYVGYIFVATVSQTKTNNNKSINGKRLELKKKNRGAAKQQQKKTANQTNNLLFDRIICVPWFCALQKQLMLNHFACKHIDMENGCGEATLSHILAGAESPLCRCVHRRIDQPANSRRRRRNTTHKRYADMFACKLWLHLLFILIPSILKFFYES